MIALRGRRRLRPLVGTFMPLLVALTIAWTCGGTLLPAGRGSRPRVIVYGFSVLEDAMDEIFPLFRERYRVEQGEDVEIRGSFAASGTVATAIVNGTPADVAIFGVPPDADRVSSHGRARSPWREGPNGGIVNHTSIVVVVRSGNPKRITRLRDLGRAGTSVVHPDPLTSGAAVSAVLAEYGEEIAIARAATFAPAPESAVASLVSIWRNVVAEAPSARAARAQFDGGFGDALVTYEVEALRDGAAPRGELVVPRAAFLTDHPAVLVERRAARPRDLRAALAFYRYLFGDEAQRAFVRHGFRSIRPGLDVANPALARIDAPFSAELLGGFERARTEVMEGLFERRVLAEARR